MRAGRARAGREHAAAVDRGRADRAGAGEPRAGVDGVTPLDDVMSPFTTSVPALTVVAPV